MKEAKVKNVFDGELFYDNTSQKFWRRANEPVAPGSTGNIRAISPKDGETRYFDPEMKVVV